MGSRLYGSDGVSSVLLGSAARKNPRLCSSAVIAHPKSVVQRDVGAVREPPLRGPIVIPATERSSGQAPSGNPGKRCSTGGGLGFFTAFRMTGTRDHSCGRRPSVIPAHERESRCGGGDGLPSARERRSIVCPSGERSEEESQAVLVCIHFTSKVGCPARCRGGSRTAPTRSHRHSRPRAGIQGSGGVCTGKTNAPTPTGFLTDVVQY